jgi:hypothetical protein
MTEEPEPLRSISLQVEQHKIDNAQRKNSHCCMIADALKDALPEAKFISVDLQSIRFSIDKIRYFYFTPTIAQHALLKFDQGIKLKPLEFTMRSGTIKKVEPRANKDRPKRNHKPKGTAKHHIIKKERKFGIRMFETIENKKPDTNVVAIKDGVRLLRANVSKAV